MNAIKVDGQDLACEERGAGDVLIFVHGAVGDFRTWETQMVPFSSRFRVIAYSRRWHHPNPAAHNGTPYTAALHAADLIAVIGAIGAGAVRLVGHSYGAAVCALAALTRPDLVRSLVLAEPSLFSLLMSRPETMPLLAQAAAATTHIGSLVREGQREPALKSFTDVILGMNGIHRLPEQARAVMRDNVDTLGPMLSGMNLDGQFTAEHARNLRTPTLLLDGELSPAMFRLTIGELANALPNAERVTVPRVSHGLHLENPEAFSRAVLEFLARH